MVEIKLKYLVFKLDKKEWKLSLEEARALFNELNSVFGPKYNNNWLTYSGTNSLTTTSGSTDGLVFKLDESVITNA